MTLDEVCEPLHRKACGCKQAYADGPFNWRYCQSELFVPLSRYMEEQEVKTAKKLMAHIVSGALTSNLQNHWLPEFAHDPFVHEKGLQLIMWARMLWEGRFKPTMPPESMSAMMNPSKQNQVLKSILPFMIQTAKDLEAKDAAHQKAQNQAQSFLDLLYSKKNKPTQYSYEVHDDLPVDPEPEE